jgi:hypothetical protein
MRTLQEKYNAIQEGNFSKDQFLRDARMQQPNLVTQFNGYDDAVQILKNRGMIQEIASFAERFKEYSDDALADIIINLSRYEGNEKDIEPVKAELQRRKEARLNEARITNKSLPDYRYKVTNEMDKYPYEQILRGLRVELEGLNVQGTPTADEYKKALAKVLKNLEKDTIYYTNQVAGISKKVDLHDKMVDVKKDNAVDKFNGLKKAELKEGFKKLIKKVLSEEIEEEVFEMYREDEDDDELDDSRGLFKGFRDDEDDEIDYDDENFSDSLIDGEEADDIPHPRGYEDQDEEDYDETNFLDEATDTEADKDMVRKLMAMYETEPSKFERLHKQTQVQAATTQDIAFRRMLGLMNRAKAGALQSLANQDRYQASIEGMDESVSLKDLL